jgi:hypothetical protein
MPNGVCDNVSSAMTRAFLVLCCAAVAQAADLGVAAFRADASPRLGEPLIWTTPAKVVADPLWAKGVVIRNGQDRYVLCALDWCGLANRAHALVRRRLAEAAGTDVSRVALHTVHQHTAPYVDATAYDLLRQAGAPVRGFSDASLEALAARIGAAVRQAAAKMEPFDSVGTARVRVERVASARRLKGAGGKIVVRYSNGAKQREMAEAPEGDIDTELRTVTLARGTHPLVRLHYYATHPQTYCCEGTVSGDFVSAAREAFEHEEGVPQVYFTGGAGDVTVGKYNDGTPAAREGLAARLLEAFRNAARQTAFAPVSGAAWNVAPLVLPKKPGATGVDTSGTEEARYRRTIATAFARRAEPFEVAALRLGGVRIVHLPGEPMLAFQRYAQSLAPSAFVAFAGYGDIAPGYLCTDRAHAEGGYEPSASHSAPGAEAAIQAAMRTAMGAPAGWRAGAAAVDITPRAPLWMAGFAARTKPSEGVLAPLHAKALALEDSTGARSVLVTADMLGFTARLSERIAARLGLPRERLVFNASHTHGGPVIDRMLFAAYPMTEAQWADVDAYTRELEDKVVKVVGDALAALAPATLALGYTEAPFAVNFRTRTAKGWTHAPNPAGAVDRTVPVLRVAAGDRTLAVVFGLACHPTVIGAVYQFHGDFAGFAQEFIERRYPGAVALYVAGFGGDAKVDPRGTVELARGYGETLGRAVERTLAATLAPVRSPLAAAFEQVSIPFAPPPGREEWQRRAAGTNVFEQRRARQILATLDRGGTLPTDYPYPIQVWQFGGDLTFIAAGGETLVDYALRMKRELTGSLWLAGYSNDVSAYIPSRRVLEEGGYEGGDAMVYYGQPGPFGPRVEEIIAASMRRLVERCRAQARP